MRRTIDDFTDSISENDLVVFFFAGHGTQWNDQNYLLPVDNNRIITKEHLKTRAINAQHTLDHISSKNPAATIFLLDCCRNYVIKNEALLDSQTRGSSESPTGLTKMEVQRDSIIVFACAPGKLAMDVAKNGRNGLFTFHLLQHIAQPNVDIEMLMRDVSKGVSNESNGNQKPHRVSSIESRHLSLNTVHEEIEQIQTKKNKFKQFAITVTGGNGRGDELSQLSSSFGIIIDNDKSIYIVDTANCRIVKWKLNSNKGQIIAGGNRSANQNNRLAYPTDLVFDKKNNSFIISDNGNRPVIRSFDKNQSNQQIIILNISCLGLTIDKNGFIYVSDWCSNEVRRRKEKDKKCQLVAGGNERGNHLNQLNRPTFIFVDKDYSLYISDEKNHRVMKWKKDAKVGEIVAGGNGQGNSLKQLSRPQGVVVDHLGQIYVADEGNHRVMRWCEGDKEGEIVVDGNGQKNRPNQLNSPAGLSFDIEENLYVVDQNNHRIQKYEKI
ncbi:unnamed protein product [Adineta steineri]|uniref:Peptidase C14 caspase domain-containing protein n=1 Tax=Adineta steineri TaxID=433720 RepID=A0A815FCV3_9BILA|nr:unnamed protein product [Adineta steineri]CAF1395821.1 unnamed protein product [Adineta steineri]